MSLYKTKAENTANQAYAEEATAAGCILNDIVAELRRVHRAAAANPLNWGYSGSMADVKARLAVVLESLKSIK